MGESWLGRWKSRREPRSSVSELLGQSCLKGMAHESPAVGTNAGSMPDGGTEDIVGFGVPPNVVFALRQLLRLIVGDLELNRVRGRAAPLNVLVRFGRLAVVNRCFGTHALAGGIRR